MLYVRKKPVDAMQLTDDNAWEVLEWLGYEYSGSVQSWQKESIMVETKHGTILADPGDYIIRGALDEHRHYTHVLSKEEFEHLYISTENL